MGGLYTRSSHDHLSDGWELTGQQCQQRLELNIFCHQSFGIFRSISTSVKSFFLLIFFFLNSKFRIFWKFIFGNLWIFQSILNFRKTSNPIPSCQNMTTSYMTFFKISIGRMPFLAPTLKNADRLFALVITPGFCPSDNARYRCARCTSRYNYIFT